MKVREQPEPRKWSWLRAPPPVSMLMVGYISSFTANVGYFIGSGDDRTVAAIGFTSLYGFSFGVMAVRIIDRLGSRKGKRDIESEI